MPYCADTSIVTCAADGQVRHAVIGNSGAVETSLLGSHDGRAHKLAIEPGSPHIVYTCGEDGLVYHFDLRRKASTHLLTCQPYHSQSIYSPPIRLNAIAIDPRNPYLFAVGGTDEYARLYDFRMYWNKPDGPGLDRPVNLFCPRPFFADDSVGITGLAFSDLSQLLVSYNSENIYLFEKDMGCEPPDSLTSSPTQSDSAGGLDPEDSTGTFEADMDTYHKSRPRVYKGHSNYDTVKGVSFCGPKCEYVVSGSDCGRIFIWRKKDGVLIRVMEADKHVVNCIEPHPHITMLASSGIEHDIKIWTPTAEEKATLPSNIGELTLKRQRNYFLTFDDDDDDCDYSDDGFYDDVLIGGEDITDSDFDSNDEDGKDYSDMNEDEEEVEDVNEEEEEDKEVNKEEDKEKDANEVDGEDSGGDAM